MKNALCIGLSQSHGLLDDYVGSCIKTSNGLLCVKTIGAGNGQYIKMRYDITGPTHQGRVVFSNLNIKNPNVKAEEIGRQQLGDIMRAIGLAKVVDTDNLIGKQIGIKVSIKDDPKYGLGNEVKGFKSVSGSTVPAVGAMPVKAVAPAPVKAAPPWVRK